MNTNTVILITIGVGALLSVGAVAFLKFAAKKGWKVGNIISTAQEGIALAKEAVEDIKPFIPVQVSSTAELVLKFAETGVAEAAQLCKVGTVAKDQRKAEAVKFVEDAFAIEGIKITPDVENLISKAVEGSVWVLDHVPATVGTQNVTVNSATTGAAPVDNTATN